MGVEWDHDMRWASARRRHARAHHIGKLLAGVGLAALAANTFVDRREEGRRRRQRAGARYDEGAYDGREYHRRKASRRRSRGSGREESRERRGSRGSSQGRDESRRRGERRRGRTYVRDSESESDPEPDVVWKAGRRGQRRESGDDARRPSTPGPGRRYKDGRREEQRRRSPSRASSELRKGVRWGEEKVRTFFQGDAPREQRSRY